VGDGRLRILEPVARKHRDQPLAREAARTFPREAQQARDRAALAGSQKTPASAASRA